MAYPDRFIFNLDNVVGKNWTYTYLREMDVWWRVMADLPDDVAHAVAHGNAERLWRIEPKPQSVVVSPPSMSEQRSGLGGGRQAPTAENYIARFDKNGDGKIGPDEFSGGPDRFKKLDTNKDGFITEDEVETQFAKRSEDTLGREAQKVQQQAARLPGRTDGRDCRFDRPGPGSSHFIVETYSPNCAFNGTTLFIDRTNRIRPVILELDMAGKVIWQYKVKDGVGIQFSNDTMSNHPPADASRLASGNTLFLVKNWGVFEIDRAGKLVWQHRDRKISHDADRLPNGNTIYVRAWTSKGDDQVREVDPDGNIVWSWTGVADFGGPEFAPSKNWKQGEPGDASNDGWIHTNAVTRLSDGRTVISLKSFARVVYVDRGGRVVESVPVTATHDPELLDNGNLLVAMPGRPGGAIEFSNGRPVWLWEQGTPKKLALPKLWLIRDANRLPNGNTLITSNNRLIEVDAAGEVVWQLLNTKVRADRDDKAISFYKATRIGPDGRAYGG